MVPAMQQTKYPESAEPDVSLPPEVEAPSAKEDTIFERQPLETSLADDETEREDPKYAASVLRRLLTPKNCRWRGKSSAELPMWLCILYAFVATFTVANLYYNQSILNKMAATFDVSYETSSQVPTLMQAGYATGLIFILPLGDIFERRMFIVGLMFVTASLWIGLCVTDSFAVFRAISYICGLTTVTPQLIFPLVGHYAPANRKAALLSVVTSGLLLGMLIARLLSGVVANYTDWRNIYWVACGAQYALTILLFLFMPDYPSTNPDGLNYFKALWSIPCMLFTEPVLMQAALIAFNCSAIFTSFWTTLTFLLASDPFNYSSLQIGLFSLLAIVVMVALPLYGRFIDRLVPIFVVLVSLIILLIGTAIGTGISTFTVAGPIIQAIFIDVSIQTSQVANRSAIYKIDPKAQNRVNTAYMALSFSGQLTGTAVGNRLYAEGGWRWSSGCSVGFAGLAILICLVRGPRKTGWFGWSGGWRPRKDEAPAVKADAEAGK